MKWISDMFEKCSMEVVLADRTVSGDLFAWQERASADEESVYVGIWKELTLELTIRRQPDGVVSFFATMVGSSFHCKAIRFFLRYHDEAMEMPDCYVPNVGLNVGKNGLHKLADYPETPEDFRFCGLLGGSQRNCLLMGTKIPSEMLHLYTAKLVDEHTVDFTVTTRFTGWTTGKTKVTTETTLVFTGLTPAKAFAAYGAQLPELANPAEPLTGWSSWDYYFSDVYRTDLEENMAEIRNDPVLKDAVKVIAVDDGWEYRVGEWYANHHFPEGMADLAKSVTEKGFLPSIWTNGIQAEPEVHMALRHGELLLKDENGNAIIADGKYVFDPTIPETETYLYETYKRLYDEGFRVFKVDFVSMLMHAVTFHDPEVGPFGAMRKLFAIIRRAVGPDSHIIGCSLEPEAGPGLCESCRLAVDIHNQWSHVMWILEYMQMGFWQNGRLWRIDPDFLVVRGKDTSLEEETNCFNPAPNAPFAPFAPSNRWRRGEVFNYAEAETWANLVVFAAGNVVLSDRLSMLNDAGKKLIYTHLKPNKKTAIPLDMSDGQVPRFWYAEEDKKLLAINTGDEDAVLRLDFARYGVEAPEAITCDKTCTVEESVAYIPLRAHESAVLSW